jgi:hypothetical protein
MPTSEECRIINCLNYKLNKLTKKVNCLCIECGNKGPDGAGSRLVPGNYSKSSKF